jgi:hypothetical protein
MAKKERFKTLKQFGQVYKLTAEEVPALPLYLTGGFFVPAAVFIIVGLLTNLGFIFFPLAVFGGILVAMIILSRFADFAAFKKIEGQPGAAGAVLKSVKFASLAFEEQPVEGNPKTMDLVFRGSGRNGLFLITEGPTTRVQKLVDKQMQILKRTVGNNVPVTIINVGNDPDQVPLKKLKRKVVGFKISMTKQELQAVRKRLSAIGGMKMPIPKGMDPNRMPKGVNRRALRGK